MPDCVEILTPDEFCARMKIGRSTFFEWKKKGKLMSGTNMETVFNSHNHYRDNCFTLQSIPMLLQQVTLTRYSTL
jgi:hypothetical protein